MKHPTSNIQHRTSDYLAVLVILLLALVRPAGAQITTSPGGGAGTVSSNDVWQIIQDIGVGGGVVSNAFVEFVIDTWYTNTTEYPALASAIVNLQTPGAGGLQTATVQMELDLGANETTDVMRRAYFTSDSGSGFSDSRELGNYIPAGARYRWWIASGSAIIDNTAPFGGYLVYFGSGGGGGSVDSSTLVLRNNGVSTNQTLVDATFEGTTSFEAIIADSLVGNGAGLTNLPAATNAVNATNLFNLLTINSHYVDGINGSDTTGDGTVGKPWATVGHAATNALDGATIYVGPATYSQGLWRDRVIWYLAEGVKIDSGGGEALQNLIYGGTGVVGLTNMVVRGHGAFIGSVFLNMVSVPNLHVDVECAAIYGSINYTYNLTEQNSFLRIANAFISPGSTVVFADGFESAEADIRLENVAIYTNKVSSEGPYLLRNSASRVAQDLDTSEIGTWLIHPTMKYRAP
jgi:hypothetical protein